MADENLPADERVQRSVARTLGNGVFVLAVLALLGAWGYLGLFQLAPGQSAVLLRLGAHAGTINDQGLHWVLPPPIVERHIVNVNEVQNQDFGLAAKGEQRDEEDLLHEASMQTSDNNIVRVSFSVQYRIKDAFAATFRLKDVVPVVRDAAQAAMREAVGRMTVDGVLRERRAALTAEVATLVQDILDSYEAGLEIQAVELQDVQPPVAVREAFDDVVEAGQDAIRVVNEAEGYRNELIPNARAEATEMLHAAEGYREAKIAEATGEAERFKALATEYRKAPEVTKKRLYLETMEKVLPDVQKVIIEKGTTNVLPYLPLGRDNGRPSRGQGEGTQP